MLSQLIRRHRALSFGLGATLCVMFSFAWSSSPAGEIIHHAIISDLVPATTVPAPETVPISTLLDAYRDDRKTADETFQGKIILLTGHINNIRTDVLGNTYVILQPKEQADSPLLQVAFARTQQPRLAKLKRGQKLTVVGKVCGLLMNVHLGASIIR